MIVASKVQRDRLARLGVFGPTAGTPASPPLGLGRDVYGSAPGKRLRWGHVILAFRRQGNIFALGTFVTPDRRKFDKVQSRVRVRVGKKPWNADVLLFPFGPWETLLL